MLFWWLMVAKTLHFILFFFFVVVCFLLTHHLSVILELKLISAVDVFCVECGVITLFKTSVVIKTTHYLCDI